MQALCLAKSHRLVRLGQRFYCAPTPKGWRSNNNQKGKWKPDEPAELKKETNTFFDPFKNTGKPEKKEENDEDEEEEDRKTNRRYGMFAAGVLALVGVIYLIFGEKGEEITFLHFQNHLLVPGYVDRIDVVNRTKARVYLKYGYGPHIPGSAPFYFTIASVPQFEKQLAETLARLNATEEAIPISYSKKYDVVKGFIYALPMTLFVGFILFSLQRLGKSFKLGKGVFEMGKSKHVMYNKGQKMNIKLADVAGCDEAKQEVTEFVSFLTHPRRYEALGAKIPKGALLVGPPGTGKTMLAKATAGEASVPFFTVSGSDFVEIYGGVGPARVRDLFKAARDSAPCIVFIDEIDAIGRKRGESSMRRNDERENTLNQLLVEMDGFSSNKGVVVLAGTNRADILDPALLRPGRFDRQISLDLPDVRAREAILRVHLPKITRDKDLDFDSICRRLAALTPGFSGADLSNVCNEAALIAARYNKEFVTMEDFEAAVDRVIAGLEKKTKVLSPKEKEVVAYHEAGHALAGWLLPNTDPVLKVSIIPRGAAALGFSQQLPEEKFLHSQEYIHSKIAVLLAGRAAEQVKFGEFTSGAQDDLQKVTRLSYDEIITYGMNETVGAVHFAADGYIGKPYSEATAQLVDEEVSKRVSTIYENVIALIRDNMEKLEQIAQVLLVKEVISHDEIRALLGPPVSKSSPEHEKFLSQAKAE